jgi:hypothetical protein
LNRGTPAGFNNNPAVEGADPSPDGNARPAVIRHATAPPPALAGLTLALACLAATTTPAEAQFTSREVHHAPALGIRYRFVDHQDPNDEESQVVGAKLTQPPDPNSPAAALGLEPGDIILSLDDQPLDRPRDVLEHIGRTKVVLIDVRTGQAKTAWVDLPPRVVLPGNEGRMTQPTLRRVAAAMVQGGEIEYRPLKLETVGDVIRWTLPEPATPFDDPLSFAERAQFQVEIIRATRNRPNQRAFWEPYLQRIEAEVAALLARSEFDEPGAGEDEAYRRIQETYEAAMQANAAAAGKRAEERPPVMEAPVFLVTLLTPGNRGLVYLMPRTRFRIRQLSTNNQGPGLGEFDAHAPGEEIPLSGRYAYKVVQPDGSQFPPGPPGSFLVSRNGPIRVQ